MDSSSAPVPLTPAEIAGLLQSAQEALAAEVGALPAALLAWHPAAGEWCAKEVLGHLIEAERRGFAGRIRQILAECMPALATWDQEAVARERRDCERPLADLLGEFAALRAGSVEQVRGLREADLARAGLHPKVGALRVDELLAEWVYHDRDHLRQIQANVQAHVWAHLGNARRFYAPDGA